MSINLKELTVLYVEDDKFTQNLIEQVLVQMVKKVYLANDGIEGLKRYVEVSPDIVLTDLYMPNMNGLEMSQKIKEISPTQTIGLFTGEGEDEIKKEVARLLVEIDCYIFKPLKRKEFFKTLNHLGSLALSK